MIASVPKKTHNQANLTPQAVSNSDLSGKYRMVLAHLRAGIKSIKCNKLVTALKILEYDVRKGSSGNHYSYSHPQMKDFHGSSFDCGHGKNPNPLPVYIKNVIKTLESHADFFDPPKSEGNENGV